MVREMLKEIRHDSRFNVMDYDSVDHLLSAIAEIEQRAEKAEQERDLLLKEPENRLDGYRELGSQCAILAERADKWKEAAVAIHEAAMCARGIVLTKRVEAAFAALGDEWDEAGR